MLAGVGTVGSTFTSASVTPFFSQAFRLGLGLGLGLALTRTRTRTRTRCVYTNKNYVTELLSTSPEKKPEAEE